MPASRLLPVFMILALALTGLAHSPTGTAPIVTDGMTTGEFGQILEKARAMEKAKSCGRRMLEEGKPFSLEELAGAKVKDEPVVIDQNWITSRKPDDLQQFSDAIVEHLEGESPDASDSHRSDQTAHP